MDVVSVPPTADPAPVRRGPSIVRRGPGSGGRCERFRADRRNADGADRPGELGGSGGMGGIKAEGARVPSERMWNGVRVPSE
ncbi:hypothetical protein GCM10022224_062090 [Nonomuraea antimicrobica]|uniref:Uncharacterized protein n=1 Tax=Nonomuraea antimicrobica TaxID=561173 RepID=A0ABP7CGN2_9ACTN